MPRIVHLFGIVVLSFLTGCQRTPPAAEEPAQDAPTQPAPLTLAVGSGPADFPGLHNVIRVSDKLLSGSSPEAEAGFDALHRLGVRTIITVDGARPDVERARKLGLRYVHLPIGYDGVPREQALRIARAVRDLPGLVYIHCHHGKHRSPAAAAAVVRCLDGSCTAEQALTWLKQAGTSSHYKGLYAAVHEFGPLKPEEFEMVSTDFPEVAPTGMFVQLMVDVDTRWDHIKLTRGAGWRVPPTHADLDPAHQALLLREAYRELARLPDVKHPSEGMHQWLIESEEHAQVLEDLLRQSKIDGPAAEKAFLSAAADCTRCHAKYRDLPKR